MASGLDASSQRIPIDTCRRFLGPAAAGLTDAQLEELRDQLYDLAQVTVASYASGPGVPPKRLAPHFGEADYFDVEERAAIMEFDGRLSRDQAERLALRQRASSGPS